MLILKKVPLEEDCARILKNDYWPWICDVKRKSLSEHNHVFLPYYIILYPLPNNILCAPFLIDIK
jgi:hypothetical protein